MVCSASDVMRHYSSGFRCLTAKITGFRETQTWVRILVLPHNNGIFFGRLICSKSNFPAVCSGDSCESRWGDAGGACVLVLSPGYCHPRPIVIWPKSSILILTLLSLPLALWGEFKFIFFKKLYTVKLTFRCVCSPLSFNACRDLCNYNSIPKPVPSCRHLVVRLSPHCIPRQPLICDQSVPIVLSFCLLLFCLWGRLCFWECYINRVTVCPFDTGFLPPAWFLWESTMLLSVSWACPCVLSTT